MRYMIQGRCHRCSSTRRVVVDTIDRQKIEAQLRALPTYYCPGGHVVSQQSFLQSYDWDFEQIGSGGDTLAALPSLQR